MATKRSYTREDLTRPDEGPDGVVEQVCVLCGGCDDFDHVVIHATGCPLDDELVLGVMVTSLSKPRQEICGECPAMDRPCAVKAWREETHETLMIQCPRYSIDAKRMGL